MERGYYKLAGWDFPLSLFKAAIYNVLKPNIFNYQTDILVGVQNIYVAKEVR